MATHPGHLRRAVAPLQGSALAVYFVLLPYVVVTKWHRTQRQDDGALVRVLLVALAAFWLVFFCQFVRDVWRLRRGASVGTGGSAWLAGALVTLLSLLLPTSAGALTSATATPHTSLVGARAFAPPAPEGAPRRTPAPSMVGVLPLALMAKRRSDLIRQQQFSDGDYDVDESIQLLRSLDPTLLRHVRQLIGDRRDGVIEVPHEVQSPPTGPDVVDAYVACALASSPRGTLVSFAREGGTLAIHPTWNPNDVIEATVALHDVKLVFADNENVLLRALATRSVRNSVVIYLGDRANSTRSSSRARSRSRRTSSSHAWCRPPRGRPSATQPRRGGVLVELLRAEPHLVGLVEPLTPTLRRRGVEMLAYLAMHRHEPVTGDRLRTPRPDPRRRRRVDAHPRQYRERGATKRRIRRRGSATARGHVLGPLRDPRHHQ